MIADTSCSVEERNDFVVSRIVEHDFVEERWFAITAGSTVDGVLVVDESVVSGLTEVAGSKDELAKRVVKWFQ